jgi:membrane-associated protease RseP (regulator of RpoE activity)
MPPGRPPKGLPEASELAPIFGVTDVRIDDGGDEVCYYGEFRAPAPVVRNEIEDRFRAAGYDVEVTTELGDDVIRARSRSRGLPTVNVVLFLATVLSTLFVGAVGWYYVDPAALARDPLLLFRAWPFSAAVLGVLGIHELGHYAMSRRHGVSATLPYFIPVPTIIGTMGAVIKLRGRMPDRRALFDIGVAGPIAGLLATVVVTAIGLSMPPVSVPASLAEQSGQAIELADPPLLQGIAALLGEPLAYADDRTAVNPVVVGGWVGMFVTFLNLLPVGQLDGGHMLRAMLGRRQATVAALVPAALFGLAGYLYYVRGQALGNSVMLWAVWGGFAMLLAFNGAAEPVTDGRLDRRRQLIGLATFAAGALCFTPVPFTVV